MRPCIGITTSWDDGTQCLDRRYVIAVERAGGLPLPLPMLDTDTARAKMVEQLDGLVVIGGPAITEGLVGDLPKELDPPSDARAAADWAWVERCWSADRPILGICYGMQAPSTATWRPSTTAPAPTARNAGERPTPSLWIQIPACTTCWTSKPSR